LPQHREDGNSKIIEIESVPGVTPGIDITCMKKRSLFELRFIYFIKIKINFIEIPLQKKYEGCFMKLKFYIVLIILLYYSLNAEPKNLLKIETQIIEKFSSSLGSSNEGKEFWLTFNPTLESSGFGNGHKIFVYSQYETRVILEVPGKGYTQQIYLNPNEVKEIILSAAIAQCYRKNANQRPADEVYYEGNAIHIYSVSPVLIYALTVYNQGSDGYLAMPVTAYGRYYVASSWYDVSDNSNLYYPGYVAIITPYDLTNVTFTLGGNGSTKTNTGLLPGGDIKKAMFKGDVLLISSSGNRADLSGSRIIANKPIIVVSSNYYTHIPQNQSFPNNMLTDIELPVQTWDTQYLITPFYNRAHLPVIRVYAKEPNTIVYRDGYPIDTLSMNTYMENEAFITINDNVSQNFPMVISADKPIYVKQYNRSKDDDGEDGNGFMFSVIPYKQQLKEYTFCTAGVTNTSNFDNYYLNIAYVPDDSGNIPIDFEMGSFIGDSLYWRTLRSIDPSPGVQFSVPVEGKYYFSKIINITQEGIYKIRANQSFPAYIYGISTDLAYGYPVGQNYLDLEKNDTLAPAPDWDIECDGTISKAYIEDMPRSNPSKIQEIEVDTAQTYNYEITHDGFIPGENNRIKWEATVIDKSQDANAVITFRDRSGNDTTISFNYKPGKLSINTTLDYGEVPVGKTVDKDFWVVNNSARNSFRITKYQLLSTDKGYELLNANLPMVIPTLDSVKFALRFTSPGCGVSDNLVEIGDSCFIAVNNRATATSYDLTANPDLDFGNLPIGLFSEKNIYIYNESINNTKLDKLGLKFGNNGFIVDNINDRIVFPLDSVKAFVRFSPSFPGSFIDSIAIGDACGYHLRLECKGNGFKVSVQPNLLFDRLVPGNQVEKEAWVVNESDKYTFILDTLVLKNNKSGFKISGITFPDTIHPTEASHFYVGFIANEVGTFVDSIGISASNLLSFSSELKADVISSVKDFSGNVSSDSFHIDVLKPNPASGEFVEVIISNQTHDDLQLNLYNEIGGLITKLNINKNELPNNSFKLNINDLQSGFYYIECASGNQNARNKFIIIR
ncbi:MAG: T9SS type A sorting domain-containing protein, partial [Bacteroidetes bacterium]